MFGLVFLLFCLLLFLLSYLIRSLLFVFSIISYHKKAKITIIYTLLTKTRRLLSFFLYSSCLNPNILSLAVLYNTDIISSAVFISGFVLRYSSQEYLVLSINSASNLQNSSLPKNL